MLRIFANSNLAGVWIFLIVLGFFALIAILAFILHKILRPKIKDDEKEKPTEKDYAKEELDRLLQPVEDDKVSEEIHEYKQNDDEE